MTKSWTAQQVLNCPVAAEDGSTATIRTYLVELLAALWDQGEQFSGKRPLRDSGWEYDLLRALGRAGFIVYQEDSAPGDWEPGHKLIALAIQALGRSG
jgi:hypothetical protein